MDGFNNKIPLIAVVGPTASGKTALGVEIARMVGGEVVSCDSMQLYKGMDIASAKPTFEEMCGVKHHMISVADMNEKYSVARYVDEAEKVIDDIYSRGKIPVLVGGTGLYFSSLVDNVEFADEPDNAELREKLNNEAEMFGNEEMLKKLAEIDPECAAKLHPNNLKRILRALEVYYSTGVTMTEQQRMSKLNPSRYDLIAVGLRFNDREKLYDRINRRVDIMLENGLLNEAKETMTAESATAAQAIGHKELFPYLKGECSLEEAVENLKRETRRYAKRQITWFSRDERINWIDADDGDFEKIIEKFIKILEKYGKCDIIAK